MANQLPACLARPADNSQWGPPLDVCDTTVRLEAAGITDIVAQRQYGQPTVRKLAEVCFASIDSGSNTAVKAKQFSWLSEYLQGISFALPLVLCCFAMAVFHASLWGGDVSANMAAAVGLGTVSSFITTGGIVQATARRGLFLLGVGDREGAGALCLRTVRIGILALAVSGIALFCFARFFAWLPAPFDLAATVFHFCLGLLWLATGILHMLERNLWSAIATAIGTAIVLLLHGVFGAELAAAQIAGIAGAAGVAFCACFSFLRTPRKVTQGRHRSPTSLAFELYVTWPHIFFGVSYYLLVFTDRLLAWSVPDMGAPSALQFRGDYETALDVALFAFVIQVGNVRSSCVEFFHKLTEGERNLRLFRRGLFIRQMITTYSAQSERFFLLAACTSVVAYGTAILTGLVDSNRMAIALAWALFGFAALVFALWNTSLLFRFSLSSDVLRAIVPAMLLNLVVGYVLTRMGAYHYAAAGFAIGALCYATLSTRAVVGRLRSVDYYFFASAS